MRSLFVLMLTVTMLVLTACAGNDDDDAISEDALPTGTNEPQTVYRELSLGEAREVASLDLLVPDPFPAGLGLVGVDITPEGETAPFETVTFVYQLTDGDMPDDPITFTQRAVTAEVRHGDAEQIEIVGRTITTFHTAHDEDGNPLAIYAWSENNVSYLLSARLAGDVTEDHLIEFLEALP